MCHANHGNANLNTPVRQEAGARLYFSVLFGDIFHIFSKMMSDSKFSVPPSKWCVVDSDGKVLKQFPPVPKMMPLERESNLIEKPVDLPKLKKAIMESGHITKKYLEASKNQEEALKILWEVGWRPSTNGIRVLNANTNPYIK